MHTVPHKWVPSQAISSTSTSMVRYPRLGINGLRSLRKALTAFFVFSSDSAHEICSRPPSTWEKTSPNLSIEGSGSCNMPMLRPSWGDHHSIYLLPIKWSPHRRLTTIASRSFRVPFASHAPADVWRNLTLAGHRVLPVLTSTRPTWNTRSWKLLPHRAQLDGTTRSKVRVQRLDGTRCASLNRPRSLWYL